MIFITAPSHITSWKYLISYSLFDLHCEFWSLGFQAKRLEALDENANTEFLILSVQPRLVLDWAWKVLEMYLAQALFIIRTSAIQRKASDYVRVSIINSPTKVVNRHLGICRWQKKVQWKLNFENSQFHRPNFLETSRWSESSENTERILFRYSPHKISKTVGYSEKNPL